MATTTRSRAKSRKPESKASSAETDARLAEIDREMEALTDDEPALVSVAELLGDDEPLVEAPLLDLSLLEPIRATVNIKTPEHPDGTLYELAEMNDFGILEQHALKRDGALFAELWNKRNLVRDEKKKMLSLLEDLFRQALIVPDPDDNIRSKMKDGHKASVVLAFQAAPLAKAMAQMKKDQQDEEARDGSTTAS